LKPTRVPTLILLHGLASNSTRWWDFVARTRLKGWKILRPDLRGAAGVRDRGSRDRGRINMRIWCDDLARLLDAEGSARAVIAGHCLGANIALNFAARYPQRTAGLVLIEPMPPKALAGSLRRLAWFRFLLLFAASIVRILNRAGIRRRRLETVDLEQWDKAVRDGTADLERYGSPFSDLRMTPAAAFLQAFAAIGDPFPDLSAIRCPALVLVSSKSTMTDPARTLSIMQAIPGVEIVQLDAEHWIPTEQPEAMCRAIEDWIARNPGLDR